MLSGVRHGVPVLWHEAVAVVSDLAGWVAANGPEARVPDLDHVGFSPSGEVFVFPGGKPDPDHVKALSSLLLAIVGDNPAPVPLIELATPRASGAVEEPLDDFVVALRFFERPNRAHDIRTLSARIGAHMLNLASDKQLAALKERVQREQKAAEKHQGARRRPAPPHRRADDRKHGWLGPVLLLALLGALVGAGCHFRDDLLQLVTWLRSNASPAADQREETSAQAPTASRRRAEPAPPRAGPSADAPAAATTPPGASDSVWSQVWPPEPPAAAAPGAAQPAFAALDFAPPEPLTLESVTAPAVPDARVYTQADAGVTPPSLAQPRLPSQPPPDASAGQVSEIEILVNEQGQVERVRLVSPTNRYSERMLLSAVKVWRFAPATKDGRPVKYLTRVRVTI